MSRLLPSRAGEFIVTVNSSIGPQHKDTFHLQSVGSKLEITGTSGVAAAWGFYYYLSQYCKCHISWAGDQVNVPTTLPVIKAPGVKVTSNDRFRYYQNVCTVSYSFVWWNWTRWEREIDWMAMNGINLPLAFTAQEAIWQRVYLKMGFTQQELDSHFGGPAFLAWARMGNMHGWGGPLPQGWHDNQLALQHKILDRMRQLGMTPVLPAFAGHVPENITRLYPNVSVSKLGDWGSFNQSYCCTTLLDVQDPLFITIGKSFLTEYIAEFGTNHIYNADTFNEMQPKSNSTTYLAAAGKAVYQAMTTADPDAIWLMQAWLFFSGAGFWKPEQSKALLTSVPLGRMILLDLFAEVAPQYNRFESFYGQPFIWCMLHDYGGTMAMYGVLESVNKGPFVARSYANSTMIGTGLTPEGINQNNVMYEFMNENAWRKEPRDIDQWISDYSVRRYGEWSEFSNLAWEHLKRSVYNCSDGYNDYEMDVVPFRRPAYNPPTVPDVWYDPEDVFKAWDYLLKAASTLPNDSVLYRYDLADVTRQSLQLVSIKFYNGLLSAYKARNLDMLELEAANLLNLLEALDQLLGSDEHFLLGRWLEDAKALGTNQADKDLYEYNARNQVTLWGPTDHNILDYANKQWSGLIEGYYKPRWQLFCDQLKESIIQGTQFDENKYRQDVFTQVEGPFTLEKKLYPSKPIGDTIALSQLLHAKFRPVTQEYDAFFKKLPELSKFGKKFVKESTKWWRRRYRQSKNKQVFKWDALQNEIL